MAKLTGPLMSLDASGSVAGTLTFSKWKGRPYVRQLVIPSNPKSVKQTSVRAMLKFLAQAWNGLTAPQKASWLPLATAGTFSNFNGYTSENQSRWSNFLAPGANYPIGTTGAAEAFGTQSATGGVGLITLNWDAGAVGTNFGVLIHRSTILGFAPAFDNLVAVALDKDALAHSYVDTPLVPGTYYYRLIPFTLDGAKGAAWAEINAVVT
jgi:hypothetical protein